MAKSAKSNSVFDDLATTLISEGNKKKERVEPRVETDIDVQSAETISVNHTQDSRVRAGNTGFSIKPGPKELKSKRVNLLLQPSVYEKAVRFSERNGVSFNELVSQFLQQLD